MSSLYDLFSKFIKRNYVCQVQEESKGKGGVRNTHLKACKVGDSGSLSYVIVSLKRIKQFFKA